MSPEYLNAPFILHIFHSHHSSSIRSARCSLFRVTNPFQSYQNTQSRAKMASYCSTLEPWSGQLWNNDDSLMMTLSQDGYNDGLAEIDYENMDVEMLDLNAQIQDTAGLTGSCVSSSIALCANEKQTDTAPPNAAETRPDDSYTILGAMASLSIDTLEQTSTEQNTTAAETQASPSHHTIFRIASQRGKQRAHQYHRGRLGTGRLARSVSHSVDPASQASQLRAQSSGSNPDVLGPTDTYIFSRKTPASERRRWVGLARGQGFQRARIRTSSWMRCNTVD
jgi:hypothetical protein